MLYATTFLSHTSHDKPIVEKFAERLVQHGIIPWLDKHNIPMAGNLEKILAKFIEKHISATVFLSAKALQSDWVSHELEVILKNLSPERILPIYLGDPEDLVHSHPLLKEKWLTENGKVKQKGLVVDLTKETAEKAVDRLFFEEAIHSRHFYPLINNISAGATAETIVLYFQQRGPVLRSGEPESKYIPDTLKALPEETPCLLLRPAIQANQATIASETLVEDDWLFLKKVWSSAIHHALNDLRQPRKVYIFGNAQLATAFLVGRLLDRTSRSTLYCLNITSSGEEMPVEEMFTNRGQERRVPLEGGNSQCQTTHPDLPVIAADEKLKKLCLFLGTERYVHAVIDYVKSNQSYPPLAWIKTGIFKDSEQAMDFIKDVVAFLSQHHVKELYLFVGGVPFHVLPLLAANLTHVIDKVIFMEYRRDLQGKVGVEAMYTPLEM